jgi:flagellar biosynthesis/type III secretory pathway protein FliH
VSALRSAFEALELESMARIDAARAEGRRAATADYKQSDAAALARLEVSIASSAAAVTRQIADLEKLSLLIAEAALSRVFAGSEDFAPLVTRAISRQMQMVNRDSLIRIRVSDHDFSDIDTLRRLAQTVGAGHVAVERDEGLARGAVNMELRLGALELSVPGHWQALRDKFETLLKVAEK